MEFRFRLDFITGNLEFQFLQWNTQISIRKLVNFSRIQNITEAQPGTIKIS